MDDCRHKLPRYMCSICSDEAREDRLKMWLRERDAEIERLRVVVTEVTAALGGGSDENLWPPGLTRGQAVAYLASRARGAERRVREMGGHADAAHRYAQRLDAMEAELAANAAMLARQCDLARQAESERDEARRIIAEIDDALGNGIDEEIWPPGVTRGQAVAKLRADLDSWLHTTIDGVARRIAAYPPTTSAGTSVETPHDLQRSIASRPEEPADDPEGR